MRVSLITSIMPEVTVYDSATTEKGILQQVLSPVVYIRDDSGNLLYSYGDYSSNNAMVQAFLLAGIALLVFVVVK